MAEDLANDGVRSLRRALSSGGNSIGTEASPVTHEDEQVEAWLHHTLFRIAVIKGADTSELVTELAKTENLPGMDSK